MTLTTKKRLFAFGSGAVFGGLFGTALADGYDAILAPALKASTAKTPGFLLMGPMWHRYLRDGGYWPWHVIPALLHHPDTLFLPAVFGIGLGGLLLSKAWGQATTWGGPPQAGKGQHGTAHWRPLQDLTDGLYIWQPSNAKGEQPPAQSKYDGGAWPRSGIIVGQAGPKAVYVANREDHVLLIGTTGAGKSRRVFLPTIGILGQQEEYSFVISDPKGELYAFAAQWLRDVCHYDVVRFDLREPRKGGAMARWNPVLPVAEALRRGDPGFAAKTAWQIAHGISAKTTKVTDEFWSSTAESAIAGLTLAVAAGDPYGGAMPGRAQAQWDLWVRKLYKELPPWAQNLPKDGREWTPPPWEWPSASQANLISVYRSLVYGGTGGFILDAWLDLLPAGHPAKDAWATVAASSGSDKTRASILSSALADLRLLSEPDLQWLLSAQGMPLDQPGRKKTAVFLIVPDDDSTRYPLATLYLSQMLGALTRLADSEKSGRLPVPVLFLLDEMGNFPPIPNLSQVVTAARSRGMRLLVGLQSFSQLEHAYGRETAQTVRENLGTWIYLLTTSPAMAEEISKRLGTYTTRTESQQHPYVNFWSLSTAVNIGNTSQGESLTSRPLLTPDEVMRWPLDQALVLQQRKPPAKLPLPDLSVWQAQGLFAELKRGEGEPTPDGGPDTDLWWPLREPAEDHGQQTPNNNDRGEQAPRQTLDAEAEGGEDDMTDPRDQDVDIEMDDTTIAALLMAGQDMDVLR